MEKSYFIKARKELWLLLPLCLCIILSGFTAHVAFLKTVGLLLTLLFFYFLPGYLLLKITDILINPLIEVFLAFFLAYSVNIFIYFFALIFGLQEYIKIIAIIYVLLLSAIYRLKAKHRITSQCEGSQNEKFKLSQELLWITIIFLCSYVIAYFSYQSNNLSAEVTGYLSQHQDNTVWLRNTAGALKTYPVPRLSTYGINLYYHMFSNFQLCFLHYITGIEIFDLSFSFSFIWNFFLLAGGVYWFFYEVLNNRFHVHLGTIIVLFTTG